MQVRSFPEAAVPATLRAQVLALQEEAWPGEEGEEPGISHDPMLRPVSLLLVDDNRVLACLDILSKELEHRGQSYAASGLSTVVTGRAARRKGYGRRLVLTARELIRESGADLGIFTCDRPLQAFYESAGWRVLDRTVLVGGTPEAPFPSDTDPFDKVTLACFFSARARERAKEFEDARIGLYPGEHDRLW